ncbi:MAG: ABC transporter substrate-binding protein [Coriobacteriales bacterium]|jgi:polar amino acid transport system substrate-binding protein|nr:ABC transporter substrate-binding protein [Coriobacteriales bacterium]
MDTMKKTRKAVASILAAVMVLALMLVGCGEAAPPASNGSTPPATSGDTPVADEGYTLLKDGKLIVGSDCDYPPFVYLEGEQPTGFEYDLLVAIADELGLEVEYLSPQTFNALIALVNAGGKMDVACSSFTINDERLELVDFTDPYFDSNQACVALKSKGFTSASDLAGLTVGAQDGTTGQVWAEENLSGITMIPLVDASTAFAALQAGTVEAIFLDEPVAAEMVAQTYTDCEVVEAIPTGEQYGIAVSKDNPELTKAINEALATLKANGTYERIFAKYFDFASTL